MPNSKAEKTILHEMKQLLEFLSERYDDETMTEILSVGLITHLHHVDDPHIAIQCGNYLQGAFDNILNRMVEFAGTASQSQMTH
jgi:hypothetical protein